MFERILTALDASERAAGVFRVALQLARMSGARLYVMRAVMIPPEFPAAAAGSAADPLIIQMVTKATNELTRLIAASAGSVPMDPPTVKVGVPWKAILELAEEEEVDLIVIGSHGYHGWDRILGTTAAKVANSATRNVFVVHEQSLGPSEDSAKAAPAS
jgi:nucleotide-binding universal stress UspA family protein